MLSVKSDISKKVLSYYFLNPEARHYTRELANILKLDAGNLHRKLSEFVKEGLFIKDNEGRNQYFSLNKNFPLLLEYKKIFESQFGVEVILQTELKKIDKISSAYIFGSFAKGNFSKESDIDLLVVGDFSYDALMKTINKLEKRWQREINVVDFSDREFKKRKDNDFLKQVFKDKTIKLI